MRNWILMSIMIMCIGRTQPITAQQHRETSAALCYMTEWYACAIIDQESRGYTWSDWEPCQAGVLIDSEGANISITGKEPQTFHVIDRDEDWHEDEGGGISVRMVAKDQDCDQCMCRMRYDPKGKFQLYIDYNNVAFCYSGLTNINDFINF